MMNMKLNLLLLSFLFLVVIACNKPQTGGVETLNMEAPPLLEESMAKDMAPSNTDKSLLPEPIQQQTSGPKKIIKDGNISLQTKDINLTKKRVDAIVKKSNAYYESEDLNNSEDQIAYNLKVRIPSANFETIMNQLESGEEELIYKNAQARDVTEEYVDTETRLQNKRVFLERYKRLLEKANSIKDILAIEENIRVLEEEIESKEGKLKYLNDQIAYSTLYISIVKKKEFVYKPKDTDKFSERVKKSLAYGWSSIVNVVVWMISIWPVMLVLTLAWFIRKRIYRKTDQ